jgi:5-methylcytosine-specific restriction protein A
MDSVGAERTLPPSRAEAPDRRPQGRADSRLATPDSRPDFPAAHFRRSLKGADRPRRADAFGNPLCRECGGPVRAPRRTFCSETCVDALRVRTSPSAARERVFARDRGICAACGLDTQALLRRLRRCPKLGTRAGISAQARDLVRGFEAAVRFHRSGVRIRRSLWEADHIVPVVEGGGGCGVENLRTLCLPCHRAVTAKLTARRARARRSRTGGEAIALFFGED